MKNTFKIIISFCFGGVIGGGIAYFLLKKKFDDRVEAEVQSVKSLYASKDKEIKDADNVCKEIEDSKTDKNEQTDKSSEKSSKSLKSSITKQDKKPPVDYANYYSNSNTKPEEVAAKEKENTQKASATQEKKSSKKSVPKVISPDEFETEEDYTTIYLTYFSDGVLADEADNRVDIDSTIGKEALKHFGEYEEDSLYVRVDKLKIYYEVLKDNRRYADIVGDGTNGDDSDDDDEED